MLTNVAIVASVFLFTGMQDGRQDAEELKTQQERNAQLEFMVGHWATENEVPGREGAATTFSGEARIRRVCGGTFLCHEWSGRMEGRGEMSAMLMMNYSPSKGMFNCTLFDKSGGEPGFFYGDWTDENTLVFKAKFVEEDGSESQQRFTIVKVNKDTFRFDRAFSDDGEHYHFEVPGTYTRRAPEKLHDDLVRADLG